LNISGLSQIEGDYGNSGDIDPLYWDFESLMLDGLFSKTVFIIILDTIFYEGSVTKIVLNYNLVLTYFGSNLV